MLQFKLRKKDKSAKSNQDKTSSKTRQFQPESTSNILKDYWWLIVFFLVVYGAMFALKYWGNITPILGKIIPGINH